MILLAIRYHGVDSKSLSNLPLLYSWEKKNDRHPHILFNCLYCSPPPLIEHFLLNKYISAVQTLEENCFTWHSLHRVWEHQICVEKTVIPSAFGEWWPTSSCQRIGVVAFVAPVEKGKGLVSLQRMPTALVARTWKVCVCLPRDHPQARNQEIQRCQQVQKLLWVLCEWPSLYFVHLHNYYKDSKPWGDFWSLELGKFSN